MQLIHLDRVYRFLGDVRLDHAVTLHEVKRLPPNRLGWLAIAFDLLGGIEFIFTLPGFWVPFVHWLWRIPTILVSAGSVSHELEDQTWNTLRATTLTVHEIIMAKFAAIIRYMEPHFMLVIYVRSMPVIIFSVSWVVSTLTVLPARGFEYWLSTSLAFLAAGGYLLVSPVLDVAFDGALGLLVSTFNARRSTALIVAVLIRLIGFLIPMTLIVPLSYGLFDSLGRMDVIRLRAIAVVSTFGPSYAFLWGIERWLSIAIVVVYTLVRLGAIRLMLKLAVIRAERIEV